MMKHWWTRGGVLALVVLMSALGGARWAASQAGFQEGAFVTAQDGTRWIVGGGQKHRVQFTSDDGNVLAGLAEGRPVATVSEAVEALLGSSAPAQAAPATSAPAPANPAEALVGQQATTCAYGIEFTIAVARVEWTKTVIGETAPGNAMWIVAFIDITNEGTEAGGVYEQLLLRDSRGREFPWRSYPPNPVDFSRAYNVKDNFSSFSPGITEQTVAVFQVPSDVAGLTLEGRRNLCL